MFKVARTTSQTSHPEGEEKRLGNKTKKRLSGDKETSVLRPPTPSLPQTVLPNRGGSPSPLISKSPSAPFLHFAPEEERSGEEESMVSEENFEKKVVVKTQRLDEK